MEYGLDNKCLAYRIKRAYERREEEKARERENKQGSYQEHRKA